MAKIQTAITGTGFMGRVHVENLRRLPNVEVAAAVGSRLETAQQFARDLGIPIATASLDSVLGREEIAAIHVCTPNAHHFSQCMAALAAGKAVLCEKPLATSASEARQLAAAANSRNAVHALQHNLRYYPVPQQIRQMAAHGDLGDILIAQGTYSQDWLLYDTDWNWRADPAANGPLRAVADIGSHWMDLIQHLTGLPITALCADLATFHKIRKRPISGKTAQPAAHEEVAVNSDDFGAILFRLGTKARGAFTVSQMSAGRKNRLSFEIFGTKAGAAWNQEEPDTLWIGRRNQPNQIIVKDASLFYSEAAKFADLPGGHAEGYNDSHKQLFKNFYARVADPSAPLDHPTFDDGLRGMILLEKVAESSARKAWVEISD